MFVDYFAFLSLFDPVLLPLMGICKSTDIYIGPVICQVLKKKKKKKRGAYIREISQTSGGTFGCMERESDQKSSF